MTEFRRAYLVCATQRSGSTLLCELLKDTGVAGRPEEYFEAVRDTGVPPHPRDFLDGLPPMGLGIDDDPAPPAAPEYSALSGVTDYREHLRRTFARGTTANGVFGAKLMFNQLAELHALAGPLPEYAGLDTGALLERLFRGPRYIWISRRDTVRQAVSMWKALQTRSWRDGNGDGRRSSPVYRFEGIDHLVRRFSADEAGWRSFFARHGITPLRLSYEEDLERDPEGTIRRVLGWIGESPPPDWRPGQPMRRQSDGRSEEWVAAYHRDRACR
ncbi:MAG TPA: Stf0 family sulfotransferase [Solirubrobacteraceae bacterium]|nr:Stf0 family sulfotransferase [Solirubrobacteraceae bacterium]